jgi:hypothetical protein
LLPAIALLPYLACLKETKNTPELFFLYGNISAGGLFSSLPEYIFVIAKSPVNSGGILRDLTVLLQAPFLCLPIAK